MVNLILLNYFDRVLYQYTVMLANFLITFVGILLENILVFGWRMFLVEYLQVLQGKQVLIYVMSLWIQITSWLFSLFS